MSVDFSDERISAYLDGELSPDERAEIDALVASSPEHRQLVDELRALRVSLQDLPRVPLADDFTRRVMQRAIEAASGAARDGQATASGETAASDASPFAGNIQELALRQSLQLRRWRQAFWSVSAAAAGLLGLLITTNTGRLEQVAMNGRSGMAPAPMSTDVNTSHQVMEVQDMADDLEQHSAATETLELKRDPESVSKSLSTATGPDKMEFSSVHSRKILTDEAPGEGRGSVKQQQSEERQLRRAGVADYRGVRDAVKDTPTPAPAIAPAPAGEAAAAKGGAGPTRGMAAPGGFGGVKNVLGGAGAGGPRDAAGGLPGIQVPASQGGDRNDSAGSVPVAPTGALPGAAATARFKADDYADKKNRVQEHDNPVFVVRLALPEAAANPVSINESLKSNGFQLLEEEVLARLASRSDEAKPGDKQPEDKKLRDGTRLGEFSEAQVTTQVLQVRASREQARRLIDALRKDDGDSVVYPLNSLTDGDASWNVALSLRKENRAADAQSTAGGSGGKPGASQLADRVMREKPGTAAAPPGKPSSPDAPPPPTPPAQAVVLQGTEVTSRKRAIQSELDSLFGVQDLKAANGNPALAKETGKGEQQSEPSVEKRQMVDLILVIDVRRDAPKPPPTARPAAP